MGITNLEEQFAFYGAYHRNPINKLIHIACVWPILWTALVFAEYAPKGIAVDNPIPGSSHIIDDVFQNVNLTVAVTLLYCFIYLAMDYRAGTLATAMLLGCLVTVRYFYLNAEKLVGRPAWTVALPIHVGCWIAQFIGHGVFEGRAPALLDNLFQALIAAPMFVLLENLFPLGYRRDFQEKVEKRIDVLAKSAAMKKSKKAQ